MQARPGIEPGPSDMALGANFGCALDAAGNVHCWGNNSRSQTGQQTKRVMDPSRVVGIDSVTQLTVGYSFACARRADGTVWCWGDNTYGQLGTSEAEHRWQARPVPGVNKIKKVAAGAFHVCALAETKEVLCWGVNKAGELGAGTDASRAQAKAVPKIRANDLWVGGHFSCVRTIKDQIYCWGAGSYGQSGNRQRAKKVLPTRLRLSERAKSLALGGTHGCLVDNKSRVRCWGQNVFLPTSVGFYATPQTIPDLRGVTDIAASSENQCAVSGGKVLCWGVNRFKHLQVPTTEQGEIVLAPTAKPGVVDADRVVMGRRATCIKRASAEVWCWGNNANDGLGVRSGNLMESEPVRFPWR